MEDDLVDVQVKTYVVGYDPYTQQYGFDDKHEAKIYTYKMKREIAELVAEYQSR